MRQFSADYLETTRQGMWEGSREALADLDLADRESVLDVGCGTGVLTRVLREECPGRVVGLDADPALLEAVDPPVVRGDATRLPFRDGVSERRSEARETESRGAFDLVVCQALLINLPDPTVAVEEFARVAADAVAVVEPDNSAVTVDSTVDGEPALARRARDLYLDGVDTDVALGASAADLLNDAGLDVVSTRRYDQVRTTAPPYSESALADARRKATGDALADDRAEILAGDASEADYDDLRQAWRSLGRDVVEQMQTDEYERTETVPFFVTVGRV